MLIIEQSPHARAPPSVRPTGSARHVHVVGFEPGLGSEMANTVGTNAILPTVAPTVMPTVAGPSASTHIPHREKSKKFNGVDFKRWQQKMLFYLTTLNLARFLTEDPPSVQQGENNRASVIALDA
ncbi:Uncharacterized protein Adt_00943 [Abeliophyllum distichum]|uniref:Uncharacterized protein n=1 Tax=Abeliophyllum distichum TaxID=126358 RepID=A0ABD1VRJ6_9LAMI